MIWGAWCPLAGKYKTFSQTIPGIICPRLYCCQLPCYWQKLPASLAHIFCHRGKGYTLHVHSTHTQHTRLAGPFWVLYPHPFQPTMLASCDILGIQPIHSICPTLLLSTTDRNCQPTWHKFRPKREKEYTIHGTHTQYTHLAGPFWVLWQNLRKSGKAPYSSLLPLPDLYFYISLVQTKGREHNPPPCSRQLAR